MISLFTISSFRSRNGRQYSTFHDSSIFWYNFHLILFYCSLSQGRRWFSSTLPVKTKPFRREFFLPMQIQCVGKVVLLCYREKKRIDYYDIPVGFFPQMEFCLTLETREKWIFSIKIFFLIFWFFDQSEFEKIEKK